MSFLNALTNIAKAGIAVAVSPVALVADIVTLPASAHDNKHPFGKTGAVLGAAGKCVTEAIKPSTEA
jgi:hypothetical protein